jgi:aspartyl-tRNA(Asn)/glutamyl-tRNA(Gln) amidotransferase subunit A
LTYLQELGLEELIHSLRIGDFSCQELTKTYLERIDLLEPQIHAFITPTPEFAIEQAKQADRQLALWRKGQVEEIPELLGIPLAVKDVLSVKNIRCTCGSRILENYIPVFNATVVNRLLDSGMVILGKTNTDEFAMGSSTENSAYGPTHNPWDLARVPGGSSGGSAAAVAARMAPAALGTDTGGSVRQPASFCGITGIKPSYGRTSRYGLIAYGSSLDSIGVLGRSASEVFKIFKIMAGHDPLDATSLDISAQNIDFKNKDGSVFSGMRIGVPQEYFTSGIQVDVEKKVREAILLIESYGAEIFPVSLPHTEYALPVYYLIAPAEASANLARYDGIRFGKRISGQSIWDIFFETRGTLLGSEVKRRIMLGTYALSAGYYEAYYAQAQKVRTLIKQDFEEVFKSVDMLAAPVAPSTAFLLGEHRDDPLAMYLEDILTLPANLAGIPAITFPIGFDHKGMPVGMQLMGPAIGEESLFIAAHAFQKITDWHTRSPEKK